MAIQQTTLTATPQAIFTATADTAIVVANFCNTASSVDTSIDVYIVPNGDSAGASTQILNQVSLTQTNTYVMDTEKYILETGDAVYAAANDAGIVTATVSTVGL